MAAWSTDEWKAHLSISLGFMVISFILKVREKGSKTKATTNQSFYQGWVDNYFQTKHMYSIHTYLIYNSSWLQKGQWKHLVKWHLLSRSGSRIHSLISSWQRLTKVHLSIIGIILELSNQVVGQVLKLQQHFGSFPSGALQIHKSSTVMPWGQVNSIPLSLTFESLQHFSIIHLSNSM